MAKKHDSNDSHSNARFIEENHAYIHALVAGIILRYGPSLRRETEDFFQEACLRILTARDFPTNKFKAQSYIVAIARNLLKDRYKKKSRSIITHDLEEHAGEAVDVQKLAEFVDKYHIERDELLARAAKKLTPLQFKVLVLRLDGYSGIEIAKAVGTSTTGVKKLFYTGKNKLNLTPPAHSPKKRRKPKP